MKRCVAFLALVGLTLTSAVAAALPQVAIVLPRASAQGARSPVEIRLRSELGAAGFSVVAVRSGRTGPGELERAARDTHSIAAIAVVQPLENGVDAAVWITDRVTGKTLLRRVHVSPGTSDAASIFAIRAVELLRASLLELNDEHRPRGEVRPTPALRKWVKPPAPAHATPRDELTAGAGVMAGPGGLPAGVAPALAFSWRAMRHFSGRVALWGPALGTLRRQAGSATLDQELLAVEARYEALPGQRLSPVVDVGIGGYHLGAHGSASAPYSGATGHAWSVAAVGGLGLTYNVLGPMLLSLELDAVYLLPGVGVDFAGSTVAEGGHPLLVGTAGLGVRW